MGRKTYLSIGRPLPERTNIVVTRDKSFSASQIIVAHELKAALEAARGDALRRGADAIAVIGGADIFIQTLPIADRLILTRVHLKPDGDTLFPDIDMAEWKEVERREQPKGPQDEAAFTILHYVRVKAA
jgi:dihydrofolate reductase